MAVKMSDDKRPGEDDAYTDRFSQMTIHVYRYFIVN